MYADDSLLCVVELSKFFSGGYGLSRFNISLLLLEHVVSKQSDQKFPLVANYSFYSRS